MPTWNPADYARHSAAQLQWAKQLQSRMALTGTEALLDLGCGDGKITADFSTSLPNGRVVGIDSSDEMIQYAREQFPAAAYPNLSFRCLDIRALDYGGEFDAVFSNAVLHWVEDHPAVLAGVRRALRGQGRLFFSFGGQGNAAGVLEIVCAAMKRPEWKAYFEGFERPYFFYGVEDYTRWLPEAGFAIDRVELVPKTMVHADRGGLEAWFRTTWLPFIERLPEPKRASFIRDVTERYLQAHAADAEGNIQVQMVRLEVEATAKRPTLTRVF